MRKVNHRGIWVVVLTLLVSGIFGLVIESFRQYGDGPSYYLMADSLIKDGDFILENKDVARWYNKRFQDLPFGAYVFIDAKGVIRYGKPVLYPLMAAPFFFFFGNRGFGLLNGLFLGGSISLGYLFLNKYLNKTNSLSLAMAFFLCSFVPGYIYWIHPEMMLFFACSLVMWLWLDKNKIAPAALVIGIVSSAKITFLLLLIPLIIILAINKKRKELNKATGICLLGMGIMLLLTLLLLGQLSPYSGVKRGLVSWRATPYSAVEQIMSTLLIEPSQFVGNEYSGYGLFFRNILNFFIGRFTGIIWYAFPGVICTAVYLLYRRHISKEDKILSDTTLFVILLLAVILIITRPLNYFGGRGFIGNRYFFILPALLFIPAIRLVKKPKIAALMLLPGLFISYQIVNYHHKYPYVFPPGMHTYVFPFRHFPLEIAQIESLPVYSEKVTDDISLYFPLGLRGKNDNRILIDKGQEVVIIQENSTGSVKLKAGIQEIVLRPKIILTSRISQQHKSFYYFRARRLMWVEIL